MGFFKWNESYSVGVKEMDAQHQAMVEIINRLHDAMRAGKGSQELAGIVAEMVDYAQYHFSSEEKVLSAQNYPGYLRQKGEHEAFMKKAQEFNLQTQQGKLALSIEVLNYLKSWWSGHILGEDQKYGAYLNAKGVA